MTETSTLPEWSVYGRDCPHMDADSFFPYKRRSDGTVIAMTWVEAWQQQELKGSND